VPESELRGTVLGIGASVSDSATPKIKIESPPFAYSLQCVLTGSVICSQLTVRMRAVIQTGTLELV
jgi:hypothetical protein